MAIAGDATFLVQVLIFHYVRGIDEQFTPYDVPQYGSIASPTRIPVRRATIAAYACFGVNSATSRCQARRTASTDRNNSQGPNSREIRHWRCSRSLLALRATALDPCLAREDIAARIAYCAVGDAPGKAGGESGGSLTWRVGEEIGRFPLLGQDPQANLVGLPNAASAFASG